MAWPRTLKAVVAILAFGYCMLVYQRGITLNFQEIRVRPVQVTEYSIDTVANTSYQDGGHSKNITLDDIFISVKTSRKFHSTRLSIILQTWFQLAKEQIWFFTDADSPEVQATANGHMINTNCPEYHDQAGLCCKTSVEFDHFMDSGKKWWCHFDDDNYVNVPRLVSILQKYNPQENWYLGKNSIPFPVEIYENKYKGKSKITKSFWFGTFGAGVCISRSLALKMSSVVSGGRFIGMCQKIHYPDDIAMGYVIEVHMKVKLTALPEFHSHLEQLSQLPAESFRDQISFGYGYGVSKTDKGWNVITVPGFDERYDPTRFLSLHCFLFPHFKFCPR